MEKNHTPHDIAACEGQDQRASPDSVDGQLRFGFESGSTASKSLWGLVVEEVCVRLCFSFR
jgi:hypothetical protein